MDINKNPKLEDLLKIKKAEVPSDVFWEKFERDLQKRTLQTFIEPNSWYQNMRNLVFQYLRSSVVVSSGLVFLTVFALFLNTSFIKQYNISDYNSLSFGVIMQNMFGSKNLSDYSVVVNNALEKDYAVEIIAIKGAPETHDFEADAIAVSIGNTVDYSDVPVFASSDNLRNSKQFTQLANFAF